MLKDTQSAVRRVTLAVLLGGVLGAPAVASAQWSQAYEQFYMPGKFNWTFRNDYPGADRLFNAFDYGHAILYERLYTDPNGNVAGLEKDEYDFITKKLLVSPPNVPLEETAIEPSYAKIAPEAKMMFDWAHLLHRQIYDVLASEKMTQAEKDALIAKLVRYYKTRPDLAFSSTPKNMDLMEGQSYSLAFRQRYPKFNGLIWSYHWLQVGLYEPLMIGKTQEEKQAGVIAAVARFRQMLENAPNRMPRVMPMTAAIAPTFAARYPEAAIIFDNLHAMHDVVSDILTNNSKVPHNGKRAAILEAGKRYRDATTFPMSIAEWKSMGAMMGIENMGGPSVGFLADFQTPTLARGASMLEAMKAMKAMKGMNGMNGMSGMTQSHDAQPKQTEQKAEPMAGMKGMSMPSSKPAGTPNAVPDHSTMTGMSKDATMKPAASKSRSTASTKTTKAPAKKTAAKKVAARKPAAKKAAAPKKKMAPMDSAQMKNMKNMQGMPGMKH